MDPVRQLVGKNCTFWGVYFTLSAMTPEFATKLHKKLSDYREFAATRQFLSCRLVHYCGADAPNSIDVPLDEIEREISGCLSEGLHVGWFDSEERLYLYVQEPDCPIPPRENVVAETALVDVGAILRNAGFG